MSQNSRPWAKDTPRGCTKRPEDHTQLRRTNQGGRRTTQEARDGEGFKGAMSNTRGLKEKEG